MMNLSALAEAGQKVSEAVEKIDDLALDIKAIKYLLAAIAVGGGVPRLDDEGASIPGVLAWAHQRAETEEATDGR